MARKRKKGSMGNLDSLLDTMTSLVGILIIILIVIQLGVKEKVKELLDIETEEISVQDIENKYRKAGVSGVPTFIINNDYVVPGAQSREFWQGVLKELTQKSRRMYS